ncbi:hypothetical protein A3A46_01530 [Candidatus Roizmanbacteria bacterium RIFCSPLOWO2_01_FULL_37_13]|uniref:Methyltransferase type 11 domain-containing protein n=1 Tax=Candidatus Roizmanbacteria bacterium RIFCSPHIGHO2_02_FULL_38_11 TaxID=1802039 RepID=A0A1F7GZK6_9BACT|nr:MAG: hypothetical protein A3C25_06020 [Candidatus Roizmanbacteria bacterium RIFCSPHIGHO2_02_FULL_38_11]OGK42549.1 MAG: hypothetical protein A3A46_01530 [Candidatus Roizmanbacteria bacterium RIFCSPLOWO2_01_FULL_37_13]
MDTTKSNSKRYSHSYTQELNPMTEIRINKMIQMIDPCEKLLDIGCWDGYIMRQILKEKRAKYVVGVDNSKPAISLCRKKKLDARWVKTVDEKLPFPKNEFDAVLAGEVIEHLYDVNTFLKEIYRLLKPNGQFIITTPNLASLGSRITILLGKIPWMIENEIEPPNSGHLRYFTFQALELLLEKHGFITNKKNVDVFNLGSRFYVASNLLTKTFLTKGRIIIIQAIKRS